MMQTPDLAWCLIHVMGLNNIVQASIHKSGLLVRSLIFFFYFEVPAKLVSASSAFFCFATMEQTTSQ